MLNFLVYKIKEQEFQICFFILYPIFIHTLCFTIALYFWIWSKMFHIAVPYHLVIARFWKSRFCVLILKTRYSGRVSSFQMEIFSWKNGQNCAFCSKNSQIFLEIAKLVHHQQKDNIWYCTFTKKNLLPNTILASKGLADGCSINGASPVPPDVIAPSQIAAVRCCSYDGKDCISPEPCLETTYDEARKKCATIGRRLCTAAEMDICCWKGCYFDDKLNWYTASRILAGPYIWTPFLYYVFCRISKSKYYLKQID